MKVSGALLFLFILSVASTVAFAQTASEREGSLSITGEVPSTKIERLPWGRDLFAPLIRGAKAPPLRLKAIFYNKKNPSAIIDGSIVYRGSTIKGFRVVEITESHVLLRGEAGLLKLEIAALPEVILHDRNKTE